MIRGYALVLGLGVIAAALFAGWYGTTRAVYFAPALFEQSIACGPQGRDRQPVIDTFEADWYGEELRGFDEPSLYRASLTTGASARSLRFTWLRSFHDPIFVRIDRGADGGAQLTAGQRAKGGRPGSLTRRTSRPLTPDELRELDAILIRTVLSEQPPRLCDVGTDGARWIIETVEPSTGYVYLNRWTPADGPVRELGLHMLGLTGWQVAEVY